MIWSSRMMMAPMERRKQVLRRATSSAMPK
jgi:hypothetical protein